MADIEAHITGTVWKIEVKVGDDVSDGDTVVILESMKMEMPVEAEDDGKVAEISARRASRSPRATSSSSSSSPRPPDARSWPAGSCGSTTRPRRSRG